MKFSRRDFIKSLAMAVIGAMLPKLEQVDTWRDGWQTFNGEFAFWRRRKTSDLFAGVPSGAEKPPEKCKAMWCNDAGNAKWKLANECQCKDCTQEPDPIWVSLDGGVTFVPDPDFDYSQIADTADPLGWTILDEWEQAGQSLMDGFMQGVERCDPELVLPSMSLEFEDGVVIDCEPWTFVAHWKHCEPPDET